MTDDELRVVQILIRMACNNKVFISGGEAFKFEYGYIRHMNVEMGDQNRLPRTTDTYEEREPSNYYWSGTCINWNSIFSHGVEFVGTEDQVWHRIQLLNYKSSITQ